MGLKKKKKIKKCFGVLFAVLMLTTGCCCVSYIWALKASQFECACPKTPLLWIHRQSHWVTDIEVFPLVFQSFPLFFWLTVSLCIFPQQNLVLWKPLYLSKWQKAFILTSFLNCSQARECLHYRILGIFASTFLQLCWDRS